ncbi:chemotaxis protein CheW [Cytobacillus sp. IB215316]|uniref:chemotaxis protein CheW n=1 Tax=Cytobacillus sp. IB215316 TaxID=3097354 RepID=UPI002A1348F4|nr:chemotaxis protein CheW [Cytobacillus sp. IB215316]MDX8362231.1 chemotaxis protein CheW [Cytobacillus sp. IB215316]
MIGGTATEQKVIVFQLEDEEYGIPVDQVRSIEKVQHITRVPGTSEDVKGVINLRGVVTPIIDLRNRFGLMTTNYSDSTRIIIVAIEDVEVGLIVDSANDVIDIPDDSIEPPPEVVGVIKAEYLKGISKVGNRLLILLDLSEVLNINLIDSEKLER